MDLRYTHPAVSALWSLDATYRMWTDIELAVLRAQRESKVIPDDAARGLQAAMVDFSINPAAIQQIEQVTRHDVGAFLEYARGHAGHLGRWLHFGLTSSDLVETALGMRFKLMGPALVETADTIVDALSVWNSSEVPVVGRTHGQPAEPMQLRARGDHWTAIILEASVNLSRATRGMQMAKLSGPVGTYAHNPPEVEAEAARELGLRAHGPGASQIRSRVPLAAWASAAATMVAACGKIAMDLRLMNLLGEAYEPRQDGQIGSTAMPQKTNMIRAEQVAGMARMAAGYAAMLQPLDLWLERDISHSSVERVAVPDLWHVLLHAMGQTSQLLRNVRLDGNGLMRSREQATGINASWATNQLIGTTDLPYDQAREQGKEQAVVHHQLTGRPGMTMPADSWYMRNYPGGQSNAG
jgi:adenylosuccinate lyase